MEILKLLPPDFVTLTLLVFMLGLKHGFDADHLATIDGLTRFNARTNPRMARNCGALFSLGHGVVVVSVALAVSLLSHQWQAPQWLVVSGMSLTVAAFGVMKLASPSMDAWSAGKELLIGGSVMATIASSFVLARWLARTQTWVPDAE